ncbi:GNAT family N-acetyltransferase [Brucella thiophenivorans]|nr:GNAT family N-acetyltransferase [Brucella thiophenivorans]
MAELAVRAWLTAAHDIVLTDNSRDALEAKFLHDLNEDADCVLVAEQDGLIRGWAARVSKSNYISDLWVDPTYHRQGTGAALLDAIIAQILLDDFVQAEIGTHADNLPAISLYEKMGFRIYHRGGEWSESFGRSVEKARMRIVL